MATIHRKNTWQQFTADGTMAHAAFSLKPPENTYILVYIGIYIYWCRGWRVGGIAKTRRENVIVEITFTL